MYQGSERQRINYDNFFYRSLEESTVGFGMRASLVCSIVDPISCKSHFLIADDLEKFSDENLFLDFQESYVIIGIVFLFERIELNA